MRAPRSPESINVSDCDRGEISVYAYADDGTLVEERIQVRDVQERVAADVNRRNALIQEGCK